MLGTYRIDQSQLDQIDASTVRNIFSRVGEDLLCAQDKNSIVEQIEQNIHYENNAVAHFLIRLNELYKTQKHNEEEVERFVEVCNSYLGGGKKVVFDSARYKIEVQHSLVSDTSEPVTIDLRDLSSGEKQIVSLFSHIYLSGVSDYFVVIDEPELSLSVPWQRRFLPDIINNPNCAGLIAVTHSPFIFDNELKRHVYSLEDFVELV